MSATPGLMPLLRVNGVSLRFGGVVALDGVSFEVERGQICGLIGPNGAGKTTLFNCISRLNQPSEGDIELEGIDLLKLPRHRIASAGIGRTFQNLALFRTMTVRQNILVGGHSRSRGDFLANALRLPVVCREEENLDRRAAALIEELALEPVADRPLDELTFAVQKRVELARALAAEPKLLLLDEPAGGLNHEEVQQLGTLLRSLRARFGLTILLVEHHLNLVMQLSDKVVAFDFGRKIAEGSPSTVQAHPDVIRAYLGTSK